MINVESNKENEIKKTQSKRYDFLDITKGIGILFVIIAHINYTHSLLVTIYSFHMPLFFFLSGMVFNGNKYGKFLVFVKRKVQTLLCPYVLFYLLSILYDFCVKFIVDAENIDWKLIFSSFLQMFLCQGSMKLPNAPLWFVPCLMIVEIIYFWISKLEKPLILGAVTSLTILGWVLESDILPFENKLLPWSLDSALFAIGFFAIGNLSFTSICKIIEIIKVSFMKNGICATISLLACIILIPLALYNGKVSMGSKILGNGIIFYLTGIIGTCGILALSVLFEKNKFLKYCGRNSFQIMAVHCLIKDFLRLLYKFFDIPIYDKTNLVETILPIIVVVFLSVLFSLFYNKTKSLFEKILLNFKRIANGV